MMKRPSDKLRALMASGGQPQPVTPGHSSSAIGRLRTLVSGDSTGQAATAPLRSAADKLRDAVSAQNPTTSAAPQLLPMPPAAKAVLPRYRETVDEGPGYEAATAQFAGMNGNELEEAVRQSSQYKAVQGFRKNEQMAAAAQANAQYDPYGGSVEPGSLPVSRRYATRAEAEEGLRNSPAQMAFDNWEANRQRGIQNQNRLEYLQTMMEYGVEADKRQEIEDEIAALKGGPLAHSRPEDWTAGVVGTIAAAAPVIADTARQHAVNRSEMMDTNPNLLEDEGRLAMLLQTADDRLAAFLREHERAPTEAERAEIYAAYNAAKAPLDAIRVDTPVSMDAPGMTRLRQARERSAAATEGLPAAGKFALDTAGSIAQNVALMPTALISPSLPLIAMGAISAADKMYDVSEAGGAPLEAMGRGVLAGGIEALTEKIPLDMFLDAAKGSKAGVREVVRNLLAQAGTEATEEGISYTLNYLADKAAGDPNAEFSVQELLTSMASGGVSGFFFGASGSAAGTARQMVGAGQNTAQGGNTRLTDADVDDYMRTGKRDEYDPSEAHSGSNTQFIYDDNPASQQVKIESAYDKVVNDGRGVSIPNSVLKKYRGINSNPALKLMDAIKDYYDNSIKGKKSNVSVNQGIIEVSFENDGKHKSVGWRMSPEKAATFEYLVLLLENAEYAYSQLNRNESKRRQIPQFHYFINNANIDGVDIPVKIQVREIEGADGIEDRYYTHNVQKKGNGKGSASPVARTERATGGNARNASFDNPTVPQGAGGVNSQYMQDGGENTPLPEGMGVQSAPQLLPLPDVGLDGRAVQGYNDTNNSVLSGGESDGGEVDLRAENRPGQGVAGAVRRAGGDSRVSGQALDGDDSVRAHEQSYRQRHYSGSGGLSESAQKALRDSGRVPLPLVRADAGAFRAALERAKAAPNNPNSVMVDLHNAEDYADMSAILGEDGMSGIAVKSDGDIVSVFKNPDSTVRHATDSLIIAALENGGEKLDNYDGYLSNIYRGFGFIPVARVAFNPDYVDADAWARITQENKRPDIVFWVHNGDSPETVAGKIGTYPSYNMSKVPLFGSYDEAQAHRDKLLSERKGGGSNASLPEGMGAASRGFDAWGQMIERHGAIPEGENPTNPNQVPQKDDDGGTVSKAARTAMEAGATTGEGRSGIADAVMQGRLSYIPITNDETSRRAAKVIERKGWSAALSGWIKDVGAGKISADMVAMGAHLYNNAVNAGDVNGAIDILVELSRLERSAGQAVQASRILKQLSPNDKLYMVQRSIQDIQDELNDKYKKRAPDLQIDKSLVEAYRDATDEAGRETALDEIYKSIAAQVPSTFADKWNAWRYMAMLANPKTHVRNIVGNVGFLPMRMLKNAIAIGGEAAASKLLPTMERTKAALNPLSVHDRALVAAAWADAGNVTDALAGVGKYDEGGRRIDELRRVFKFVPLEKLRQLNNALLEGEDFVFSRLAYSDSLAGYLKANGVTAEQMQAGQVDQGLLDRARAYAVLEAQKATFRDANAFSNAMSKLNNAPKWLKPFVEGVLPFKKTPANILVRGLEYSPIGWGIGIGKAISQKVTTGEMSATQLIDSLAAGAAGTAVMALGAFLASQGLLIGGPDEDEAQAAFDDLQGAQDYALVIGDKSYTLGWLAPASMPLFVGVEIWNAVAGQREGNTTQNVLSAINRITEPMLETSMLGSLEDILSDVSYADNAIAYLAYTTVTSYLSQAIPTLSGQAARTLDDTGRRTYVDKNSPIPADIQMAMQRAAMKIPGLLPQMQPYVDAWGRTAQSPGAAENFVLPFYTSERKTSAVDSELQRLYDATGETVFPKRPDKSVTYGGTQYNLTGEEYTQYSITRGQMAYDTLRGITESSFYKGLDDADKTGLVADVYAYANDTAKRELLEGRGIAYESAQWEKAYALEQQGIGIDIYLEYRELRSDAKNDVVRTAIMRDGRLNEAQKTALDTTMLTDGQYIPRELEVDYSSNEAFRISQMMAASAREKWPEVKERFGITPELYSQAWAAVHAQGTKKADAIRGLIDIGVPSNMAKRLYNAIR